MTTSSQVTLLWDRRPSLFDLRKLKEAWLVLQGAPADLSGMKLSVWLTRELKSHSEFEGWETGRYAVAIMRGLWRPE